MKVKSSLKAPKNKFRLKSKHNKNRNKSRKEIRKEQRLSKKQRRLQHTINKIKNSNKDGSQSLESMQNQTISEGNVLQSSPKKVKTIAKIKQPNDNTKTTTLNGPTLSLKAEKKRLSNEMMRHRTEQLKIANKEEDKNIKHLEKLLKMNRRKSKAVPKAFISDGLDYLLDVCDSGKLEALKINQINDDILDSDFEEDFTEIIRKPDKVTQNSDIASELDEESTYSDSGKEMVEELSDSSLLESEDSELSEQSDQEDISVTQHKLSNKLRQSIIPKINIQSQEEFVNVSQKLNIEECEQSSLKNIGKKKNKNAKKLRILNDNISKNSDESMDAEESHSNCPTANKDYIDCENKINFSEDSEQEEDTAANYWEDIYGRKRDRQGNVVKETRERYIPPALRGESSLDSAKLVRLKRQMKGLLNRVAESNMGGVASQLEDVIAVHSRGDACRVLGQLILAAVASSHAVTPTKMVAEHALLLSLLHAHIGSEIGATLLETTVTSFVELYDKDSTIENKTLNNLLLLLCFMYSFKIFHSSLLFDILQKLSERFNEKDVELILLILKHVGGCLRKDNPSALKDCILQLQKKATITTQQADNSRIRFMLDVLLAIKNNNMSRIRDYNPELVDHLRKCLRGVLRKGSQVSELKISLEDLLKAEERGKWWVVGSAWQGIGPGATNVESKKSNTQHNFNQKLLELARKQRMNTDVRKNIFCILMSAEDFLDAFEKLLHLSLKGQQEREIFYVLLDCCIQELKYNPYYYHLAQKFCDFDRKHKMSLQCSIWDKLKNISELTPAQLHNIAYFTYNLILSNGLNLSVLKVIEFADLDKRSIKFLRQVLLGLLLCENHESFVETFCRVSKTPQLSLFREGLHLFLHKYILHTQKKLPDGTDIDILTSRVSLAQKILLNDEANVTF